MNLREGLGAFISGEMGLGVERDEVGNMVGQFFLKEDYLNQQLSSVNVPVVGDLEMHFYDNLLEAQARIKMVKIPVVVELSPLKAENGVLFFKVERMKPINAPWVKRVLHRPPLLHFDGDILELHLKELPKLEKMPLNALKGVKSTEGRLTIEVYGKGVVGEGANVLKSWLVKTGKE